MNNENCCCQRESTINNRVFWQEIEPLVVNGRQGVCYATPPCWEITVNTVERFFVSGNRVTVVSVASRPKTKKWWEFWK